MQWFGQKQDINRFLGQVDQDDPTNLPMGLAAVCRNTDFTRDSPGVTCCTTRAGINLALQGIAKSPISSGYFFQYTPDLSTQAFFQMLIAYDLQGNLMYDFPAGTGRLQAMPVSASFTPPAGAHMNAVSAGNKLWAAFSNLKTPNASGWACIDPRVVITRTPVVPGVPAVNPAGMKPVGWYWQPRTSVRAGEVCCPSSPNTGNGHTYQAQNAGTTAATQAQQPVWPLTEGGTVNDNGIVWQELTMVLANRLPSPVAPTVARDSAAGTFAAALDVYVVLTFTNDQGETPPGPAGVLVNTVLNDALTVTLPTLASLPGWVRGLIPGYIPFGCNLYVASVPTGSPAPAGAAYELYTTVAPVPLGSVQTVTTNGTGNAPPTINTARVTPAQLPTPDDEVQIERSPLAGTFPAGRDVYIAQTYLNGMGETPLGPLNSVINTVLDDGILCTLAVPEDDNGNALYNISQIGIYEADVATGAPAPLPSQFRLVGYYGTTATPTVLNTAVGQNPPTVNGTGPGGAIVADTATGGPNGTQGMRYAVPLFMNQNQTVSGFTLAAVVSTDIDLDGYEIAAFNVFTGPLGTIARPIAFTVADSSQEGPFNWIGNVELLVPTQNFIYPQTQLSDAVEQSATVFFDNVTTQGIFNFSDTFLLNSNNVDDRTDILPPFQPVRIDYLKTTNQLAFTGVQGFTGGALLSVPGDYESVYADVGPLPFPSDGQRCFGVTDAFKSSIFVLREESGYVMEPNSGNPGTWTPVRRWGGELGQSYGPCGFRAWAACGKFIIFVHRSGVYKYDESDPDLVSKEVPRQWATINWLAAETIQVWIDEDTHTVRIQVPTGASMVPNMEFCLSYLEGWQNPIHFSTFSGKEISMDAARRWSFNDVSSFFCFRANRSIVPQPPMLNGPDGETQPSTAEQISQLLYCTSSATGQVNMRTPGRYDDNGLGIDWQYRTVCVGLMQALSKPEGINLNADGNGTISAWFLASRSLLGPDEGQANAQGGNQTAHTVPLPDFALVPQMTKGLTLKCPPEYDEYWSIEFSNNRQPGVWASLKSASVYLILTTGGRDPGDS